MTYPAPSDLLGQVDLIAPGILGLFSQGVLTGLVMSQLSIFLNRVEHDSRALVALVAFVTVVALYAILLC